MKFELMYAFLEFAIIDTPVVKLQVGGRIAVVTSAENILISTKRAYRTKAGVLTFQGLKASRTKQAILGLAFVHRTARTAIGPPKFFSTASA
jgi:hypothetical protein